MPKVPPHPVTPDGRYFVVRGRLWRMTNPALSERVRARLQKELMSARSALGHARRSANPEVHREAQLRIDAAKEALGERGEPWWEDGAPDYNRKMAVNTPYREWFESL